MSYHMTGGSTVEQVRKIDKLDATGLNYRTIKHHRTGLEFGSAALDGDLGCFIEACLGQARDDRSANP